MKHLTSITFVTEESVVLHDGKAIVQGICPRSGGDSLMTTPEALAILATISEREIFRLIESGGLCFVEAGRVLVCLTCFQAAAAAKAAYAGASFSLGE